MQRIKSLKNKRKCGHHPEYVIIKFGQNTEKSPGYLKRLAVTQTPVNADVENSKEENQNRNGQHDRR